MDAKIINDEEALGKCSWCNIKISENSPVYAFGIKFNEDVDLTEYEGRLIELSIVSQDKIVPMLVTVEGSDAKTDGHDAMFMTCSKECGDKMRDTLLNEKSLGDIFKGINFLNNF